MESYRPSVFVVTYSKEGNRVKYLLLKRKSHWKGWEFPKEGIESGESEDSAVKRCIKEETGLSIKFVKKFDMCGKFQYKKKLPDRPGFVGQTYSLYSAEVNSGKIKMDEHEHAAFEWLEFNDAMKRITWQNQRDCLKIVNDYLEPKNFRKITTNKGTIILAGKDENSNEELVKQVSPDEFVFHTAVAGSPFVNVKGNASAEDLKIAGIFCAKFSRDWKKNHRDVEMHKFRGRDIYKKPGMKAGTFGVKKFDTFKIKKDEIEKFSS